MSLLIRVAQLVALEQFGVMSLLGQAGYFNAKMSSLDVYATTCPLSHLCWNLLFTKQSENAFRCFGCYIAMHLFALLWFNVNHQIKIRI